MIWYVIIGLFAAFGVLCALWILLGAWLTDSGKSSIVIHSAPGREETVVRRYLWLRDLGLVRAKLVIVLPEPPEMQQRGVEYLTLEQYIHQLIEERKKLDGT